MFIHLISHMIVASAPTDLSLVQEGGTNIIVSWNPPMQLENTTGYRVYWFTNPNNIIQNETSATVLKLSGLVEGECYNVSVGGISEHLPSEFISHTITLS